MRRAGQERVSKAAFVQGIRKAHSVGLCGAGRVPQKVQRRALTQIIARMMLDAGHAAKFCDALPQLGNAAEMPRSFSYKTSVSEAFEHALDNIFFENKLIAPLTIEYGVF
jgi:hypothetical protein